LVTWASSNTGKPIIILLSDKPLQLIQKIPGI